MEYGGRPLRSTRRLANSIGQRPGWYSITNAAEAGQPTQVSIYDEIGFYGVSAGSFLADLKGISGDIQVSINSPGGDVFDGLAIFNQLKQRQASGSVVGVIIDGLAASAASFIAQAASPGKLEIAPHAQMMIHNGFSMAIGDAADLRQTADLLDKITAEIASIYAERSGKPVDYWLAKMSAETWFSDKEAVAEGLADNIHGQKPAAKASWDLSVYGKAPVPEVADSGVATTEATTPSEEAAPLGDDGWVQDPDGSIRFDPDGDGDDDSTPEGDTDHSHFDASGKQIKPVPARPDPSPAPEGDGDLGPEARAEQRIVADLADMFPVLNADVDRGEWDAGKAWAAGAASDDPAKFYAGICAGRRAGDPDSPGAWALPYRYEPGGPPNANGVKDALAQLIQVKGLTNEPEATATLTSAAKRVNPDYDPDNPGERIDPAVVASVFTLPAAEVDDSAWNPAAALAIAANASDPAAFYRAICAGRKQGDPSTPQAWALPYRYTPNSPPNSAGVRAALAELAHVGDLANRDEAHGVLSKAMKAINPAYEPEDEIDPALLGAAFALALG